MHNAHKCNPTLLITDIFQFFSDTNQVIYTPIALSIELYCEMITNKE